MKRFKANWAYVSSCLVMIANQIAMLIDFSDRQNGGKISIPQFGGRENKAVNYY